MTALIPTAAFASWVSDNCSTGSGYDSLYVSRDTAKYYAFDANGDGYEWGGGCWDGDGVDDTPGAPDSGGEGPDCSGFTFKSWYMKKDWSAGWRGWPRLENVHGPYTAADFKNGTGAANVISKTYATTKYMDAFASATHIGMIYAELSNGQDRIIEAKGDAQGTGIWTRTYRSNTDYGGVRRANWAA
ncbi:MAG: hypothetical protein QM655_04280 [Nocardioidaceae bacterium]